MALVQLKRVTFIIGFNDKGQPVSMGFGANEFRDIWLDLGARTVVVRNSKPDSTEVIKVVYSVDKYQAIEYIEKEYDVPNPAYRPDAVPETYIPMEKLKGIDVT